jgi:hypothetical protein
MARGLKIEWRVYSARRRISVKALIEQGIVTDYGSFVAYCETMSVIPMSESDFNAEASLHVRVSVAEEAANKDEKSTDAPANVIEATVWLAGVKEELPPAPEEKKTSKKPKKQEISQD